MISASEKWREQLLVTVLIVGGVALTIFPIVYFLQGRTAIAIMEGVCGLVLWLSLVVVKIKHTYIWPARIGWGGVVLALAFLLFTGGVEGTGLLWWPILPVVSFVLFRKKGGLRAVLLGIAIVFGVELARSLGVVEVFFATDQIVMMIVSVGVLSALMYNYEKISGQARDESIMRADLLEEQVSQEDQIRIDLKSNLEKLGIEKDKQQKVRAAMINLLEDAKELENQLKTEKEGVERKVEQRTMELQKKNLDLEQAEKEISSGWLLLQKEKAKLDSSIENLPVGFLMIDIEMGAIVTNPLVGKILGGVKEVEVLARLKKVLEGKLDFEKYVKNCDHDKKSLVFSDIEIEGKSVQILLSPILTKEPSIVCIGVVALVQDITEAKNLERSKDEFFSIASHELRTPLTAIRGNTSMILEYYKEAIKDPELRAMIDDVHESSIRLINIVNDFLNVSRLEQSKMVFEIKPFDVDKLIPEILKEYDVTGSRKKIKIEYASSDGSLPMVLGDSDKVRQVLVNLVGNSLKFTKEGVIRLYTETGENYVKIFVSDTGSGIPLKLQSLLFHKFQQAGSSLFTRDTAGGSGLGLYISRMMMEGMKGAIALEKSEENRGTTFSICLPRG